MEIMLQTSTLQEYKQLRGWCCVLDFHFGFGFIFCLLGFESSFGFCLFFILTKMTKKRVKKNTGKPN